MNVASILGRTGVALLFVASALFSGCSSNSGGDDDDDDDDDSGGSSIFGGTTGRGGNSGQGGTTGLGGSQPTGGSGGALLTCISLCERVQLCPTSEPVVCADDCQRLENEAAAIGCTTELRAFTACWAVAPDVCNLETAGCDAELMAYIYCG